MPPLIGNLLQLAFLLLLYLFVYRAVRAVVRDLRSAGPPARAIAPQGAAEGAATADGRRSRPRRRVPSELVVHHPDQRPHVVSLGDREVTFGRAQTATIQLGDPYASDHHARVYEDGGEWLVTDLGSTNGTYLNQVKVTEPMALAPGDQLGIGKTRVEVRQ